MSVLLSYLQSYAEGHASLEGNVIFGIQWRPAPSTCALDCLGQAPRATGLLPFFLGQGGILPHRHDAVWVAYCVLFVCISLHVCVVGIVCVCVCFVPSFFLHTFVRGGWVMVVITE